MSTYKLKNQYVTMSKSTLALAPKYYIYYILHVFNIFGETYVIINFDVTWSCDTSQRAYMSHSVA